MNRLCRFAASLALVGVIGGSAAASAEPVAPLSSAVYDPARPAVLDLAQFRWGGNRYCWYNRGWRGPGWYRCGFAFRRGMGWGGPGGWHGWRWRGRRWRGGRWR